MMIGIFIALVGCLGLVLPPVRHRLERSGFGMLTLPALMVTGGLIGAFAGFVTWRVRPSVDPNQEQGEISQNIEASPGSVQVIGDHNIVVPPSSQRRHIDAEVLGKSLRGSEAVTAAVWNDGTVEAGGLARQLEIGLQMAGWKVSGGGTKMADPDFFPDAITIEVSAEPQSTNDHSVELAKKLRECLGAQHVESTVSFTKQRFPLDFIKIKVAGR